MLQRRGGLQVGEQERALGQPRGAAGDRLGHGDDVGQAALVPGREHHRLGGVLDHRQEGVAVGGGRRHVGRLGHRHGEVQIGQGVHQARGAPDVGEHRRPPRSGVEIDGVGQVGAGAEVAAVTPEPQRPGAVPPVDGELGGGMPQRLLDDRGGEPHQVAVADRAAGVGEQGPRLAVEDAHPGAAQDLERGGVDLLELGVGQQAVPRGRGSWVVGSRHRGASGRCGQRRAGAVPPRRTSWRRSKPRRRSAAT